MKKRFFLSVLLGFVVLSISVFPVLSNAQQFKPIKPQVLGKTYWCAEVEDILYPKEPVQGERFTVGVRVKFTKKTVIPGAPGQKLCSCAFEGPTDAPAKAWSKTMSLRLIGIKYSANETDLLEYGGPTPAFYPYDYSGFPVIGFIVTKPDLEKGYIEVWNWASKDPLQARDFDIYVSLAIYPGGGPYDKEHECHFHGDFKKSFKPKVLQVPKIDEDKIKKGAVLRIPPEKFLIVKRPLIKFVPFNRVFFKIPDDQKEITLKEKVITINGKRVLVRNAKTISVEQFLKEVNEIEEGLNKLGYSLRDTETIKIKYIYSREQFVRQKEMLSKDFLKRVTIPLPPQTPCEGYSEGYSDSSGRPKDFVPLDWNKNWDASFGNADFGVSLAADLRLMGDKKVDVFPSFKMDISLFGKKQSLLEIIRKDADLQVSLLEWKKTVPARAETGIELINKGIEWETGISFPVGPINISGSFGFEGQASATFEGNLSALEETAKGSIISNIKANAFAELGANYEIVTAGVGGELTLIETSLTLNGEVGLENQQSEEGSSLMFVLGATAEEEATLLKGSLYVYGEIDYWLDSKRFEIEFYNFPGFTINKSEVIAYDGLKIPAEKDHQVWLKIDKISGITPYTARNEKLDIEPASYDLIVDIDGRKYTKTLKDYNKDGIYGNAIGEYEDQVFEIPLLSYKKVPISIEVVEKYKIGTLEFNSTLDFAKGDWKRLEICYDPGKRTFTYNGTETANEDVEVRSVGDTTYWGEKYHGIEFEIGKYEKFKAAPAKAK
ncbi:MAG: hypothetical protein ACUVRZ_08565 [Desulfobacca sp.]|uniref:hypothetical protein n=1 Tax=Desulfobacca sp. TaxID=2067990 RepID=UPI00404A4CDF